MLKKIKRLGKDEFIKGSLTLLILMGVFNLLNYFFHFSMARLLGPADYGILAVLMSIAYILGVLSEAVQTVISKYTSKYLVKKDLGKIKSLLFKTTKKALKISSLLFLCYIFAAFFISGFLKISFYLVLLTGIMIFAYFLIPINRGILQGRKKFSLLGINMIIESSVKLVFSILLVFVGLKIYGAVFGILTGLFVSFFITFIYMKDIFKSRGKKIDTNIIYSYGKPAFIVIMSIILMYSIDIIFAKRFFSPDLAGKYAVASMLGKMIFLGTYPISKAMFPLSSENYENKRKGNIKLFKKSLKIVLSLAIVALIFYFLFPEFIIRILFGYKYIEVSNILFIVGLAFTFISLANLIILYNLSINKIKNSVIILPIFVVLEIIFFFIFHSNLIVFSLAFLVVSFLMFIYSIFTTRK